MTAPGIQKIVFYAQALLSALRGSRWHSAPALMALVCLVSAMTPAFATTYYVSPTGSDSNTGTTTSAAWQTIAKVNSAHFVAGDSVLFQGSGTFTGALVFSYSTNVPTSSSTDTITVSSYGTGTAEILSSSTGSYSSAVKLDGVNGITVSNLTILGGGGASPTTWEGVYILNQSGKSISGITVNNCNISNFAGTSSSETAEVYVNGYYGDLDTVKITNNQLHGANGVGSTDSNGIYGIGHGQDITNVTYAGNTVYNLGGLASAIGGGIVANDVNGGVEEYNIVHDIGANTASCGGVCGIWAYASNNITIQFNEVYNVQPINFTKGCDWDAYDLDGGVSNSVVQYNYSHHNAGIALLAYSANVGSDTWGNNIYRYNISENDAMGAGTYNSAAIAIAFTPTNPIQIYGNTFYMGLKNSTGYSNAIQSQNGSAVVLPSGSIIENNIFDMVAQSNGNQWMYVPYGLSGGTIDYNIYYDNGAANQYWRVGSTQYTSLSAYQTATGYDKHSFQSNPGLLNPGGGGTLSWTPSSDTGPQPAPSAYWLTSGAAAYNAGVTVSGASRDYYGDPVPNGAGGFNIGAFGGSLGVPAAPSNLAATWATMLNGWFKLTWTDNSSNETGFTIQSYNGTTWTTFATVGQNATSYTRTGIAMPSGPYTMQVVATNPTGTSTPSNQVTFSLPTPPAGPTGLTATPGTGQVALTWNSVSGASNYSIQRATASGGPYSVIKYNNPTTSYTDTSVISGTTYYYEVNWNDSAGGSLWSTPPASATPN
jgi:hypothetical protein